jgi:hypothetical protein
MLELAQPAIANKFACQAKILIAALLAAGLKDALCFSRDLDESLAFVDGKRERLFAVDILFASKGGDVN